MPGTCSYATPFHEPAEEAIPTTERAHLIKCIEHIERAASSPNGNPAYWLSFTDGSRARTAADAACAYTIGNPGIREGCTVTIEYGPRGTITHLGPYTRTPIKER